MSSLYSRGLLAGLAANHVSYLSSTVLEQGTSNFWSMQEDYQVDLQFQFGFDFDEHDDPLERPAISQSVSHRLSPYQYNQD